jgi:hypothetical protein
MSGTGYAFFSAFGIFVLFAVTFLIVVGIGLESPGLAALVALMWWLPMVFAVLMIRNRSGTGNTLATTVAKVGMVFGVITLLVISVIVLLLLVCMASGPVNFH